MSVYDVLDNPSFVALSLVKMISDERDRIVTSGLAPEGEVNSALQNVNNGILKIAQQKRDWNQTLDALSYLHGFLSGVKLPGDFISIASDPLLLDLSNLPILDEKEYEEKFYDIDNIISRLREIKDNDSDKYDEEGHVDVLRHESKYHEGPHEDFANDDIKTANIVKEVASRLEKIAYSLGRDGKHTAAYMVERTMRDIKTNY